MTPAELYQANVIAGHIQADSEQLAVLSHFQRLYLALIEEASLRKRWYRPWRKPQRILGLYLYGSVGIGKTFLMDCFYESLPFSNKMRLHFHRFMAMVHERLKSHQGEADPLQVIARDLARETMILCFDELFVSDITDAMILARLFRHLFDQGITLVTTSNVAPENLYLNGLQRVHFLPAIAMLQAETEVVPLISQVDYRLRHLREAGVFYTPIDSAAELAMQSSYDKLTQGEDDSAEPIVMHGRQVPVIKRSKNTIWFEFSAICKVPRSQQDYLYLAEHFKTVMISHVPQIAEKDKDTICLFISFIDVLYDARVRLVISSTEPVEQIYERGVMQAEFTRTHSRLIEMQSQAYFAGGES